MGKDIFASSLVSLLCREVSQRCHFHKRLREGIGHFAACMLSQRSCNLSVLAESLGRDISNNTHRVQYLRRVLAHPDLSPKSGMSGFIPDLLMAASSKNRRVILAVDQTQLTGDFSCLMLSVCFGGRAFPLLWRVIKTRGAIGWDVLENLLDDFSNLMPLGLKYCLMADRFYGHSALINWCDVRGLDYRIQLKNNLNLLHQGGKITTGEAAKLKLSSLENVTLGSAKTHIGILHETCMKRVIKNHGSSPCRKNRLKTECWMEPAPAKAEGMRWGIEAMFSDFKTRGFYITESKLKHPKRLENIVFLIFNEVFYARFTAESLQCRSSYCSNKNWKHYIIFIMSLALITASFIGIKIIQNQPHYIKKNTAPHSQPSKQASGTSQGL